MHRSNEGGPAASGLGVRRKHQGDRRLPGPAIELREVQAADGTKARTFSWVTRYVASGLVLVAGLIVMLVGLAGA